MKQEMTSRHSLTNKTNQYYSNMEVIPRIQERDQYYGKQNRQLVDSTLYRQKESCGVFTLGTILFISFWK